MVEIVQIPVLPENTGELAAMIDAARDGYLAPPRCERFEVLRGDGEIAVVVRWSSASAHSEAASSDAGARFVAAVGELAAGPPSLARYES